MFNDERSEKIVIVAHCILNQNSISDGTADFPGQFSEVLKLLQKNNIGIIQLPCPELMCIGLDRGDIDGAAKQVLVENSRIRNQMEVDANIGKMKKLAEPIIYQIKEYRKFGFDIIGLIGINRSPSCGVETTSLSNREDNGQGVFIDVLIKELAKNNINIKTIGVKTSQVQESIDKVKLLIGNEK